MAEEIGWRLRHICVGPDKDGGVGVGFICSVVVDLKTPGLDMWGRIFCIGDVGLDLMVLRSDLAALLARSDLEVLESDLAVTSCNYVKSTGGRLWVELL